MGPARSIGAAPTHGPPSATGTHIKRALDRGGGPAPASARSAPPSKREPGYLPPTGITGVRSLDGGGIPPPALERLHNPCRPTRPRQNNTGKQEKRLDGEPLA